MIYSHHAVTSSNQSEPHHTQTIQVNRVTGTKKKRSPKTNQRPIKLMQRDSRANDVISNQVIDLTIVNRRIVAVIMTLISSDLLQPLKLH